MASDISNIIKSEIASTLESLLSVSSNVDDVKEFQKSSLESQQCIKAETTFEFSGKSSQWKYYIPTKAATKFEYLMLGGVTDLKDKLDDEIVDAVKEIISTISGSISTSVNAQGFDDISGLKFTLGDCNIIECDEIEANTNSYLFEVKLDEELIEIVVVFDDTISSFVPMLSNDGDDNSSQSNVTPQSSVSGTIMSSILGEESVDNLKLLFDIKLRLSVRLGTKVCLLRDVISWDIGEIIELSQMTSEPLDILVNGVIIGKGEAIIVDGKFGIKIKSIGIKNK
ncbi:MAG: FliM/FliN family flagellar motor switch protein [Campylobacterota bacterium]|nr:FliM/FliN family flagellar motor switch protein [Campylobacterota bacterium]